MKKVLITFLLLFLFINLATPAEAFIQLHKISSYDPPGFFSAIWHGLLAPYSLVARWFISDVVMYAIPNTGWFYDFGFLIGMAGSIPIGWIATILSTTAHIFS